MTEQERYEKFDLPFYREQVTPVLPPQVLDFHVHIWKPGQRGITSPERDRPGAKYMVIEADYGAERLLADAKMMFPDQEYRAVCFGSPTLAGDKEANNAYVAEAGEQPSLHPLMVLGRDQMPPDQIKEQIRSKGFLGYKVAISWLGDDYGDVTVADMIGPNEMAVANELGLVVLLHVPSAGRLTTPEVQQAVREYAEKYPNAQIVLAHCGRCYHPDEMAAAVDGVQDCDNVYLDTAMVMDPTVLQIVFEKINSRRVLFATDFPVAAMRGRRVYVMDHWVDVVLEGYPESAFRVASSNIRATFMAYEIVLAIKRAADRVGLSAQQLRAIFYDNGMAVLHRVMGGQQLEL